MKNQTNGNRRFSILFLIVFLASLAISAPAADGDLDLPFNVSVQGGTGEGGVNTVVVGADGKIYIAGDFNNIAGTTIRNGIARFNSDGTIDTTFVPANDNNSSAIGLALQSDGKVITNTTVGGSGKIARFNADGSLDSSFAPIALTGYANVIKLQTDGKILVGGNFNNVGGTARSGLIRLNSNGSLDTAFVPTLTYSSGSATVYTIALQTDGKILIGGDLTAVNGTPRGNIARLNADGTLDAAFATGGAATANGTTNTNATVADLAISPNGKIYIGGNFSFYDGAARNRLARLNADGSVDSTFAPNISALGSRSVTTLAAQPDNKLLVGGFFTVSVGGTNRNSIFRLNADGSLDTTFAATGTNGNGSVGEITLQPDGKILVGGIFNTFNGVSRKSLVRLQNTVTVAPTAPRVKTADFDNDGKADASIVRVVNGALQWFVQPSSGAAAFGVQFGQSTDKLAPADYDGDGKTDIAVWREGAFAYFYILQSSTNTVRTDQFGQTGDVLTVGDWDGDGKAEPSVYRDSANGAQSYFYYRGSLNNPNGSITFLPFGTTGDKPMRGDFDGDGKFDAAIFRPSNNLWIIRQSSNNQIRFEQWGTSTDRFVPADYDGDGKFDLAVFRSGVWYIKQSSDGQAVSRSWGAANDTLVPADYDGDGKTDVAVYRNGIYYVLTNANTPLYINFGAAGDVPIASAYVQ